MNDFVALLILQGNITTAIVLDRELAGSETYTLTVLAADDAIRSRQGTTQVSNIFKLQTLEEISVILLVKKGKVALRA